jgi:hypothetical protein
MIRKWQVQNIGGDDMKGQTAFVVCLFNVAANRRRLSPRAFRSGILQHNRQARNYHVTVRVAYRSTRTRHSCTSGIATWQVRR